MLKKSVLSVETQLSGHLREVVENIEAYLSHYGRVPDLSSLTLVMISSRIHVGASFEWL